jgi:hypothetical protein
MTESLKIEICYALPDQQKLLPLIVEQGVTAQAAVIQSGIQSIFLEIDLDNLKLAIFSTLIEPDYQLQDGDRIEILRPLLADPKEVRKRRAAEMKAKKDAQKNEKAANKSA